MKYQELTAKPDAELKRLLDELESQKANLAMKVRMSQEKQTHRLKILKRDIARIQTLLTAKTSA